MVMLLENNFVMNKYISFLRKNTHRIYKVQVLLFLIFILLTIVYYNYPQAHRFFNRMWYENSCFCFDYLFSAIMTILFACFFWIILVYPLVYLFSLFFMKMGWKRLVILLILYLTSFVCEFSLYTIPIQQMFKERKKQDTDINTNFSPSKSIKFYVHNNPSFIPNRYLCR